MTRVTIDPGVCGFIATVEAVSADGFEVTINVASGCPSVSKLFQDLGNTFDAYELCLVKPGTGPFYAYAAEHFPQHGACPVIAGILKAVEVECRLALPKSVTVTFEGGKA